MGKYKNGCHLMWSPQALIHIALHTQAWIKKNTLTRHRIKRSGIKTFGTFKLRKLILSQEMVSKISSILNLTFMLFKFCKDMAYVLSFYDNELL